MKLKKITALFFIFGLFIVQSINSTNVYAAAKNTGITVSTALKGKKSVIIYFKNLQNAKSVSYMLSYSSKLGPQGALGTVSTKGKYSLTRELLFGTCSNKVCRYDTGIKNCVLEVTTKLKNGKTDVKRFKLKV